MKFSIIIPVYNLELYIEKCVNSVLDQTYRDYEILLIDDGSQDKSAQICDQFANQYPNIKVKHVKNGGASYARNIGIKMALGDYIMFMDGDDYLYSAEALEQLYSHMNADTQILMYKMISFYQKNNQYVPEKMKYSIETLKQLSYEDQLVKLIHECQISIGPCDKVIKRSLLQDYHIFFPEGISGEDIVWSFYLYTIASHIDYSNDIIYVYRKQREGAVTSEINDKKIKDTITVIDTLISSYQEKNDKIGQAYMNYIAYQYTILLSYYGKTSIQELKNSILSFRWLLQYDTIGKVKKVKQVMSYLGIKITAKLLSVYRLLRENNWMRI